jgi:hypothetical protein
MLQAAQLMAVLVFVISATCVLGYLFGIPELYTWTEKGVTITPMAIPTAISLMVLSFAVFSIARVIRNDSS